MRSKQHTHPFAIPLLAGIVALLLWPMSHFLGIGTDALKWAFGIFAFYSGAIILTLFAFGFFFCVGWLADFVHTRVASLRRKP
jgi:hypothetical protein